MVSLVLFLELQHLQLGWPYEHAWYSVWNDVLESAFGPHFTIHPQAPINGKYPDFAVWHYPKGKPVLALLVEVKRGGTTGRTQATGDLAFYADAYYDGSPDRPIHLLAVAGLHFRFFRTLPGISRPVPVPVPTSNWMDMRMHYVNFGSMVQNTVKSNLKAS